MTSMTLLFTQYWSVAWKSIGLKHGAQKTVNHRTLVYSTVGLWCDASIGDRLPDRVSTIGLWRPYSQ